MDAQFYVQTLGVTGEGPRSVVVCVKTRPVAPADPPRNFRVSHVTKSEIQLCWDQPEYLFGHLAGYKYGGQTTVRCFVAR